jgi:hypothetical protein
MPYTCLASVAGICISREFNELDVISQAVETSLVASSGGAYKMLNNVSPFVLYLEIPLKFGSLNYKPCFTHL